MKTHLGGTGGGWRIWGISYKDHWFIGLSIKGKQYEGTCSLD